MGNIDFKLLLRIAKETGKPCELILGSGKATAIPRSVPASDMVLDAIARRPPTGKVDHLPTIRTSPREYVAQNQRGISCREFGYLIKKWAPYSKPATDNDVIKLAGAHSLSSAFHSAIGERNTTDIHSLDDEMLLIAVFEVLVEAEAIRQSRDGNNRRLEGLLHADGVQRHINHHKSLGASLVNLIRHEFNLSRLNALATLAHILGMQYEYIGRLSSEIHVAELNARVLQGNTVPKVLHMPQLPTGASCAELVELVNVLGNAKQVIGAIAMYHLGNRIFCLPATVGRGVLSLGRYKPTAHLLNQHLMDKHPHAPIVFCQDMRTALALQRFLGETRGYSPDELIVTAHLGEDLLILPWNYLFGHDIVFVCAPTKLCMAMVKGYETQVRGAGAKSFKVHLGFLLHSPTACDLACGVEGITQTEGELLRRVNVLDDEIQPLMMLRRVIEAAVSYTEFKAWGQSLGIFKKQNMVLKMVAADRKLMLPEPDPALVPPRAYRLSDVTLYHTMRPGNYVMLLGAKGAGKTQLALSSCGALLKSNVQWPLFSGQVMNAGNIAYVDAETPYDEYNLNLEQHNLAPELGRRFFGLNKFAPDLPPFCNSFNLADENFREGLFHYLLQRQCRFVFLDNLAALLGDRVDHGKLAKDVLDWVEKLQKASLCVVLVHHKTGYEVASPNTDKARGSQLFSIRARTIIALQSKTEILDNRLGTETVQTKARADGLTVGLRFTASKAAPVLECKTLWLHLPLGATQWEFLALTGTDGKETELPHDHSEPEVQRANTPSTVLPSEDGTGGMHHCSALLVDCTDEECTVYEFIKGRGSIKNADVRDLLNCEDTKAGGIFNSLIAKRLIKREGLGPATRYRLA